MAVPVPVYTVHVSKTSKAIKPAMKCGIDAKLYNNNNNKIAYIKNVHAKRQTPNAKLQKC